MPIKYKKQKWHLCGHHGNCKPKQALCLQVIGKERLSSVPYFEINQTHMGDNQLIGVFLKEVIYFEPDFLLSDSFIEGYLVDKTSKTCIKASSSNTNLFSYVCPFTLENKETETGKTGQAWKQLLVIDKNITELNSEGKILIFEVCKSEVVKNEEKTGKLRVALAFLIPLAPDGSMNTNQDLKLQLYKIRKDCKVSHQDCNIYHLYSDHKLKKILGFLQVSVKGVVPIRIKKQNPEESQAKSRPLSAKTTKNENLVNLKPITKSWEWSRLPSQSCKVPNKIHKIFSPGKNGFSCLKFSRGGTQVAAAALSKIFIHEVISGNELTVLYSHIGFIYELDWSFDDKFLLSVSNDCRGVVWDTIRSVPVFVLPHPSYVYCGKWFGNDEHIVTGGKDHLVRYWRRSEDGFHLIEEMGGHSGYISALATHTTSLMISGDSIGGIMIRTFDGDSWTLIKTLTFSEFSQRVIDSILIHSSRRRIIISVRAKCSYLIDFVSGIILQTYKSTVNTFARSISCLTPCESYFFSFCQNGDVGVWEVNTGKVFATYANLFATDRLTELSGYIHYHPYEHMVGIAALMHNHPFIILKYEASSNNDSKELGLNFPCKKPENSSPDVTTSNRTPLSS